MSVFSKFFKHPSTPGPIDDWRALWTKYASKIAPSAELAKTKQELVVTCAGVIDKIWNGNGGGGWDEGCETDYIEPLRAHLCVDPVFTRAERAELESCLDRIVSAGRKNSALQGIDDEDTYFESDHGAADAIVRFVVRWCRNYPEPIPISEDEEYHGHDWQA